ncbi:MAG TPA: alpha-hydroxy acid oxidase [Candidatus Binatia bacterium]|jgi:4-hydroxymandelate oxidase
MKQPERSQPIQPDDFEETARQFLPRDAYDYFAGGACDEATLRDNRDAFARYRLLGRVLRDVSARSLQTTVLGQTVSMPVMIAPVAMQKLAHQDGELATARAAARAGALMIASTMATTSLEEIATAGRGGPRWFQLYVYKDRGLTAELVRRAEASGYGALVLTVDGQVWGRRYRDMRNGFSLPDDLVLANLADAGHQRMPGSAPATSGLASYINSLLDASLDWNDFANLVESTSLPVVVKGILHADDARLAVAHGAAAVFVSNHGGRQLDGSPATMDVLESVVDAVAGRAEVYLDGGVRRGSDVIKALALGARAVAIGRPVIWALASAGERGVARLLTMLGEECDIAMALCGAANPAALDRSLLV